MGSTRGGSEIELSHASQAAVLDTNRSSIMQLHREISCLLEYGQDNAVTQRVLYTSSLGQG